MLDKKDLEQIKKIVDDSIEVKTRAIVQESESRLTKKIEDESAFLARISADEFRNVGKRFDVLENRFDVLEKKVDGLSDRLDFLEKKLDSMGIVEKAILSEIQAMHNKLETKISRTEYLDLENKVVKLEKLAFVK